MTHLIPWVLHKGWEILGQFSKFQGEVKCTHTSLAKVDEFFHLSFPHKSKKERIKEIPIEDLPTHWTTSKCPIISPLCIPCFGHIIELIGHQLDLLN